MDNYLHKCSRFATKLKYMLQLIFFISGNFYSSLVSNLLAYFHTQKQSKTASQFSFKAHLLLTEDKGH